MEEVWTIQNRVGDFAAIAREFGITEQTARLIVNRGYTDLEEIREYLYPDVTLLPRAEHLPDIKRILQYLVYAIKERKKIRVFGDYDVDGVTATYLCINALRSLGATVDYCIPNRMTDGYGISDRMVNDAIHDRVDVVLTVDNGIAAVDQTNRLKSAGITVLITDHHEPQEQLPEADAICDPKLPEAEEHLPICGAVVAGLVMSALCEVFGKKYYFEEQLDILALATVCDVMPVVGVNRAIIKLGIQRLKTGGNDGLSTLMEVCGIMPENVTAGNFGFQLGPCINALGRLDVADEGVELLLERERERALELSKRMVEVNIQRKALTDEMEKQAILMLGDFTELPKVVLCYLPNCHESIAGIVAGRVRQVTNRPTIVLTNSEDPEKLKGSARSINGVSIFEIISKCKEFCLSFGGHEQAAGLSIRKSDLEVFRQALLKSADYNDELLTVKKIIDIQLPIHLVNSQMVEEIELLAPFGEGNADPKFVLRSVLVNRIEVVGREKRYWKFHFLEGPLVDGNGPLSKPIREKAITFINSEKLRKDFLKRYGYDKLELLFQGRASVEMHLMYVPEFHEFNGNVTIQYRIIGYKFK